ncbi:FAD-dependent oxidoreductase [Hydrogenobacter thermophilus]|uniref:FAD-dependent oxidoreductase n=1 Tax=Hydrogenobacter thermophilus TaxID=940 RepID=UPI0030F8B1E3
MRAYDIVIIGAGGAGLRTAIECARDPNIKVAVVSKVYPTRSHTGAAQGGVNAALGNVIKDDSPEMHAYDTIKGSDFLADQDAVLFMCENAPDVIYELDRWGVPFSRLPDGRIAQRPFGGASFPRTVFSADRTGHVILHTLFEQALSKENIDFYNEFFFIELLHNGHRVKGVSVYDIKNSEVLTLKAKAVVIATGGFARIYWQRSTNAVGNTGDGVAVALRNGIPLKDIEFIQFHPTGLAKTGILLSEACRGEGGYLLNKLGERFMQRYAPEKMELAPRDLVSRAIEYEIREGRGVGEGTSAYVYLDLRHLGEEKIRERLPQVRQLAIDFEGVDPITDLVPIRPTAHYCMGGIHIENHITSSTPLEGLYAVGEAACVSVHGANRLGGNSLVELLVFGKFCGIAAREYAKYVDHLPLTEGEEKLGYEYVQKLMKREGNEKLANIRKRMGEITWEKMGIFRDEKSLLSAYAELSDLLERWEKIPVVDKSKVFNTNLIELMELRNMLEIARAVAYAALHRRESRGGHYREDYPERDDENFLKHTIIRQEGDKLIIDYIPVRILKYQPAERKY